MALRDQVSFGEVADMLAQNIVLGMAVALSRDMRRRREAGLPPHTSMQKHGEWVLREYSDLTEQWSTLAGTQADIFLETMEECGPGYRVVNRKDHKSKRCPPVISGPHATLEAGKAAYLLALATL